MVTDAEYKELRTKRIDELLLEIERLQELIKQMQVMGRAVDNIAQEALKPE
jgi:hypothetical protein